ncbi:MAG: aldo/keto reductase [Chloroflexi bacterium]|nr:aldo/keto reductase [Chloroflexota bacterium]
MMQYGHLPGINKPVSRLVQGTVMVNSAELDKSFALLDKIYALGCNTFDTAHAYGDGDSERTLGRWLRERGGRDQVVVITKGAHPYAGRKRVTPVDITADLHESLARLQVEAIDLYLLHRDDPEVPVGPLVEVLNEHQQAGRIWAYGLSNWSHERIQEALAYAAAQGLKPAVASSPHFSLAEQVKEPWPDCISISGPAGAAARDWYGRTQVPLFTWSSLAGGFFSGRFRRDNLSTLTDPLDQVAVQAYAVENNFRRLERAALLAEEKGLTLPQVALAYVLSQELNIFAIVGCQHEAEFVANLAASEVRLPAGEIAWLELSSDSRRDNQ